VGGWGWEVIQFYKLASTARLTSYVGLYIDYVSKERNVSIVKATELRQGLRTNTVSQPKIFSFQYALLSISSNGYNTG